MHKYFYTGIFILVISILIPIIKVENLSKSIINSLSDLYINKSEQEISLSTNDKIIKEIAELQNKVKTSKNEINELVQQSYDLNVEINQAFNDSLMTSTKADSINYHYSNKLTLNEKSIDSINLLFGKQSDLLIKKINDYTIAMQDVNRSTNKITKLKSLIIIDVVFILIYFSLFVIGITKAISLLRKDK